MKLSRVTALAMLSLFIGVGESCADLPSIERSTCGNRVIDTGEECDTFAGVGERCRTPDEADACRFDCSSAKCPAGYACNTNDGLCRKPSGTFADQPSVTFEANAQRLQTGDFDGDGVTDLLAESSTDELGRGSLRVFYLDDPTQPPKVTALAATAMSPVARDLDGDGLTDIAFSAFETGVNLLRGRKDRTFAPIAFARVPFPKGTSARMVRLEGVKEAGPFGIPLIFANPMGASGVMYGSIEGDPRDRTFALLDQPPANLLAEPIAANVFGDVCDEIVFAWKGTRVLNMIAPCAAGKELVLNPTGKPTPILTLPMDDELARPPVAADLNGDGIEDLLLTGKLRSYVSFSRGTGTYSNTPDLAGTGTLAELECDLEYSGEVFAESTNCTGGALAAYTRNKALPVRAWDRTVIAFPNLVMQVSSIAISTKNPAKVNIRGVPVANRSTGQWTSAIIADFNGNGYIDVAAASTGGSDIDFFNGTPYPLINPSKLTTDGPVANLSAGDYDGDLVTDLAYVELGVGGEGVDGISVAYGRFMSPPDRGLRMGVFPTIGQIGTAKLSGYDALEQIGVIYGDDPDLVAILEGAGDRQLLSPFGFAAEVDMGLRRGLPYITLAGQFDEDKANADLVMLGYDERPGAAAGEKPGALRLWYAPGSGGGGFGVPSASTEIKTFELVSRDPANLYGVALTARAVAGDLDGDGVDEAIVLASDPMTLRGATLSIGRVKKGGFPATLELSPAVALPGATVLYTSMQLATGDIDGDGKTDAIVLLRRRAEAQVFVAFGNGTTVDAAGAIRVTLPDGSGLATSVATLQLDADPARELAIATTAGVFMVNAQGRDLTATKVGALPAGDAIASGDFNADGIADLAIAKDHRVGLYLGTAVNP